MTDDQQRRQKNRKRLWLVLTALAVLLAVFLIPPFVSVRRYKSRITSLIAASLGRPVRISQFRGRLLPRPGFVLYDLTVDEDPEFGSEPLLRASTVTASIRLLSLWRGRLVISEISVDEASLNLVRTPAGRWNLDSLVQTAASRAGTALGAGPHSPPPLPYLEATNSRINFKNGVEKLPFSLVNTDLSFWQEKPGQWRIRLRGQPARTDVSLDLADTGVVELNASAQSASDLRQMPVHLDLEWRDAQLGQLTRLATGSDAGWRGDLRGEIHLDGTADAANITTRLRAAGVHRAEFAPVAPMDFDANCSFVYHYSQRDLQNLACESPLGDGHVRLAGDLPGDGASPRFSVELDKVPVAAALEALRTFRSGVNPALEAAGTASGKISYAEVLAGAVAGKKPALPEKARAKAAGSLTSGGLTGSIAVDGFELSGGGLSRPVQAPKLVLQASQGRPTGQAQALSGPQTLTGSAAFPLGGPAPLTVNLRLGVTGYQVTARGQASIVRSRELAHVAGLSQAAALDALAGDPLTVDLDAEGPWLSAEQNPPASLSAIEAAPAVNLARNLAVPAKPAVLQPSAPVTAPVVDTFSGTVTLRNANWKSDYLANHVNISEATVHLENGGSRWAPVAFSYGPLKGTASLVVPAVCDPPGVCPSTFQVAFGDLDAATVQTAILGAREKGTLLSDLIDRLHLSTAPVWPRLQGSITAASIVLGPLTLNDATAQVDFQPARIQITSLAAALLGGSLQATGALETGDKPSYMLAGDLTKLNPAAVGELMGETWRGGTMDANGKIELSGYTGADLANSAKGTLHFEWKHGSLVAAGQAVPPVLSHFDRWTADAGIADGKITIGQNQVAAGNRKRAVEASATLDEHPKVSFAAPRPATSQKKP
jgi:hypothetical protein